MQDAQPLLELKGISKSFPGVRALNDVNFAVGRGEVVSLLGQNGAGKSTLMSIIGGIYTPDEGVMTIAGKEVRVSDPGAAEALGIVESTVKSYLKSATRKLNANNRVHAVRMAREAGLID